MSRSKRKYPIVKCEKSCKTGKRFANRRVRRYKGFISNGKDYKRLYCSWDICDYYFSIFEEDVRRKWYARQKDIKNGVRNWANGSNYENISLEEALLEWKKTYLNK